MCDFLGLLPAVRAPDVVDPLEEEDEVEAELWFVPAPSKKGRGGLRTELEPAEAVPVLAELEDTTLPLLLLLAPPAEAGRRVS